MRTPRHPRGKAGPLPQPSPYHAPPGDRLVRCRIVPQPFPPEVFSLGLGQPRTRPRSAQRSPGHAGLRPRDFPSSLKFDDGVSTAHTSCAALSVTDAFQNGRTVKTLSHHLSEFHLFDPSIPEFHYIDSMRTMRTSSKTQHSDGVPRSRIGFNRNDVHVSDNRAGRPRRRRWHPARC